MKPLSPPHPSIFFTALLATNTAVYQSGTECLQSYFGPAVHTLGPLPFKHTSYYTPEMGPDLVKGFLAFVPPFSESDLKHRKLMTREIEWKFSTIRKNSVHRSLNVDPGFVTLSKMVLGTGKNFSHRIYLGDGIFAEVTLIYHAGGWEILPWTFPDYKRSNVQTFLTDCRIILKNFLDDRPKPISNKIR